MSRWRVPRAWSAVLLLLAVLWGCSTTEKPEPLTVEPGMETAVLLAKGMH